MIDFKVLRHDKNHHLGLGDVRLTMGQQEEIEEHIKVLERENESLHIRIAALAKHLSP